jgi:hypothetical protein
MNMKIIIISLLAVLFVAGCVSRGEQSQRCMLIWRETSSIPIEKVPSPDGFKISPAKAVTPIMKVYSRLPSAEYYLFADKTNYYFGITRKGTVLDAPEPDHYVINGTTGKTTYKEKKNTEPKDALDKK